MNELPIIQAGRELEWRDRAACLKVDPELFHPEGKYTVNSPQYRLAVSKAITYCARCEVRGDCLEFGMSTPVGIYGGATSSQRKLLRANRLRIMNLYIEGDA